MGAGKSPSQKEVFMSNREYIVRFADGWEAVEYNGAPPQPGTVVRLVVERLSESTRSLILQPADQSQHL